MNQTKQNKKEEKTIDVLKRLAKRIEEATVDIHEMKSDLKLAKFRLNTVENNTQITKIDGEKTKIKMEEMREEMNGIRGDIKKIDRNTNDLIETTSEILVKMVSQRELESLSQRIATLEQQ